MNVIVTNEQQQKLAVLDVDIIKNIQGSYTAFEIVEMFKDFFCEKIILDATAIKDYNNIQSYQILARGLGPEKLVLFLPEGTNLCTPQFLAPLVTLGIYNFTTNTDGVKYLLKTPNTLKDVEHIQKMGGGGAIRDPNKEPAKQEEKKDATFAMNTIIGIKNATEHAGSTTLTYMMKKELNAIYGEKVIAMEINKKDFPIFNEKNMLSVNPDSIRATIEKYRGRAILLVDIADYDDLTMCTDVIYLVEPSTIKLNKLIKTNRSIFNRLKHKKVVLNKSLLNSKDLSEFEYEAGIKVFYNMPPLNERKQNDEVVELLRRIGLVSEKPAEKKESKVFGLFRR